MTGGLAVTEDGARLFVVQTSGAVYRVDTRTGVAVAVCTPPADGYDPPRCCVLDPPTRSILMSDCQRPRIVRLCGVEC
jgi:hypothetical protein